MKKTTLLDVLASRKNVGVITGDVLMNGRPVGIEFQRGCAYAEQLVRLDTLSDADPCQDTHEWTTTVREALRFSAYLRQPQEVPVKEKNDYVEDIIELLELQDLADGMIGFPYVQLPLAYSSNADVITGGTACLWKVRLKYMA